MNRNYNENNQNWITTDNYGRKRIVPQMLYIYLKENMPLKITDGRRYFLYENNFYRLLSHDELKAIIKSYLPEEIRSPKDWDMVFKEFMSDEHNIREEELDADESIIGFLNGVLNIETGELMKFNKEFLLTRLVPCKYKLNQNIKSAPIFYEYINTLCDGNQQEIDFLLEYIGAVLSNVQGWRFKKLLILEGDGNTGKTQIREFVISLLGKENNISIDIGNISARFGTAPLNGVRLAGSGDMSGIELSEMTAIKNLTGGDDVFAERKGKDGFSFRYKGFLWFNANTLPYFRGDRGQHVYSRFAIIKCKNVIPIDKQDPNLQAKMLAERDIVVSVAVDKFIEAVKRGYKFTLSENMMLNNRSYQMENNSLFSFIKECCVLYTANEKIRRAEFNEIYKRWCSANRVLPERDREIGKQLKEFFLVEAQKVSGHYFYPIKIKIDILNEYKKGDSYFEFNGFKNK